MVMVVVFYIALDRFLKMLALSSINFSLIGDFFKFNFYPNYNIAFSLPLGGYFLNIFIGLIILVVASLLLQTIKKQDFLNSCCLLFVLAGAISNFFDRIRFGFVIDYLELRYFTIFNLADVMIFFGVLSLLYFSLIKTTRNKKLKSIF